MLKVTCALSTFALATGATFQVSATVYSENDCTGTASDTVVVNNPHILPSGRVRRQRPFVPR